MVKLKFFILCISTLFISSAQGSTCEIRTSIDSEKNQIHDYYSSKNKPERTALILPPTGGENVADRNLARTLCAQGLNAVIFNYVQSSEVVLDFSIHDENTRHVLKSLNQFLESRHEPEFVIVGSSLGSLYASIAFSLGQGAPAPPSLNPESLTSLHKLKGAILTVCGGSLAEILTYSQIPSVQEQVKLRKEKFSITSDAEYKEKLEAAIELDPLKLASPRWSHLIYQFQSNSDVIVPTETQLALWEAYGKPSRSIFFTDHMWTIAWVYYFRTHTILQKALSFPP